MLETALKARLPLISTTTRDPLATKLVLDHLVKRKDTKRFAGLLPTGKIPTGMILYTVGGFKVPDKATVENLESHYKSREVSVVVVNPTGKLPPNFYDAGEMPTPLPLVQKMVKKVVGVKVAPALMPALGGLTLKEVSWLIRIASATQGELTRETLTDARRNSFPAPAGLQQINSEMGPYVPEPVLKKWAKAELPFFMNGDDPRLRPKGLLLAGDPGTGKTMAAKWVADSLSIPAYRLHCGSLFNKYVGETEKAMTQALAQVDRDEPCVLLLDEVEKIFGGSGGATGESITKNVLGELLWWLQEHSTRVLTVMTTNAQSDLPRELYRPGRIDEVMTFKGVGFNSSLKLARHIAKSYDPALSDARVIRAINDLFESEGHKVNEQGTSWTGNPRVTQAAVSAAVVRAVKQKLLKPSKSKIH